MRGYDIDIALPRKETAMGNRHKDFKIDVDPFIGTVKAAERRDFTINAIMQNVLTGEITDHFGGAEDLNSKIIRHVNDRTFTEDPLRVLRAAQFAARFEFDIADETAELCRAIDLSTLSKERIFDELCKAVLKADKPSVFFEVLRNTDQLSFWFPEVKALIGTEQSPVFHAEGDVWNHTMLVLDCSAAKRSKVSNPTAFMLSALTHDFGKTVCSEVKNGEIHAYRHETEGLPLVKSFLSRITNEKALIRYVMNMVEMHMKPNMMTADNASIKATNKMFDQSAAPEDLIYLASCDNLGSVTAHERPSREPFLLSRYAVYREYMARPYVTGKDLVEAGIAPGDKFSEILAYAHKLRLAGIEKQSALKQTLNYASKL